MSLSKSKCWYLNNCLNLLKHADPLDYGFIDYVTYFKCYRQLTVCFDFLAFWWSFLIFSCLWFYQISKLDVTQTRKLNSNPVLTVHNPD